MGFWGGLRPRPCCDALRQHLDLGFALGEAAMRPQVAALGRDQRISYERAVDTKRTTERAATANRCRPGDLPSIQQSARAVFQIPRSQPPPDTSGPPAPSMPQTQSADADPRAEPRAVAVAHGLKRGSSVPARSRVSNGPAVAGFAAGACAASVSTRRCRQRRAPVDLSRQRPSWWPPGI
jgi:hypothetical protein